LPETKTETQKENDHSLIGFVEVQSVETETHLKHHRLRNAIFL
jgi:hypothetical protein